MSITQYSSKDIFVRGYKLMFYMTNTQHKFIIIDLICNIHTVANYNNLISYLGAIRS